MCTQDIQAVTKAQHKHRNPPQTRSSALFFLMREMTIYRNCLRESWIFRVVTFCKLTELHFSLAHDLFIRTWKKYHFSTQHVVWSAANSKTTYHFHLINISFHFCFYEILPMTHAAPVQINNERKLKFEWNHNVKEDRLLCNYFMDKKYLKNKKHFVSDFLTRINRLCYDLLGIQCRIKTTKKLLNVLRVWWGRYCRSKSKAGLHKSLNFKMSWCNNTIRYKHHLVTNWKPFFDKW